MVTFIHDEATLTLMDNKESLKSHGFFENQTRLMWINRSRRIAFTEDVIDDHDCRWLESKLLEDIPEGEFRLHSNRPLAPKVCMEILDELGLSNLLPVNPPRP